MLSVHWRFVATNFKWMHEALCVIFLCFNLCWLCKLEWETVLFSNPATSNVLIFSLNSVWKLKTSFFSSSWSSVYDKQLKGISGHFPHSAWVSPYQVLKFMRYSFCLPCDQGNSLTSSSANASYQSHVLQPPAAISHHSSRLHSSRIQLSGPRHHPFPKPVLRVLHSLSQQQPTSRCQFVNFCFNYLLL